MPNNTLNYVRTSRDSSGKPVMFMSTREITFDDAKEMLRGGSRALAPISLAGAFSSEDFTPRVETMSRRTPQPAVGDVTRRSADSPSAPLRRNVTMAVDVSGHRSRLSAMAVTPTIGQQAATLAEPIAMDRRSAVGAAWPAQPRIVTPTESECGHNNAGQELCYLCHQRAARNIPVSFDEEKKRRELEEDKILHDYQVMKNNEFILSEQEKNLARRHDLQRQAAFNLGVAEAIHERKHVRALPESPKAYIFQRRPLTPPRYLKQQQLSGFLSKQIDHKDNLSKKERADQEFLERLEQVQLAEDLAAQREMYLRNRHGEREKYKDALATQLKYKAMQVPDKLPDNEVFGKNDTTQADIIARREHARRIADEQINTVSDRKRSEVLKRLHEQQEEEGKIRQNRSELLEDRSRRYERLVNNRRSLEQDWVKAAEQKKGREIEEHLRCLTPGLLVHEQCDKYKRCAQCNKRTSNCGETNLWKESYYIPGARIMV